MRKSTAVTGVLGLAALALVGCSSQPVTAESCGRGSDGEPSVVSAVEVAGEFGAVPEISFPTPLVADEPERLDVVSGDGDVIETMGQPAVLDITLFDGSSGAQIPMTGYSGDETQVLGLEGLTAQLPGLEHALECAAEGTRTVAALGKDGASEAFAGQLAQLGLVVDPSSLFAVIDVVRVLPASADGSAVYNEGHGLPSVVRAPDGTPGVIVPDGDAPAEPVTETLLRGDGPEISETDVVTAKYTSVDWESRRVTSSTWSEGVPFGGAITELPGGSSLEGATVGSQVMLVEPDGEGGATVTVVDLLGAVPAS